MGKLRRNMRDIYNRKGQSNENPNIGDKIRTYENKKSEEIAGLLHMTGTTIRKHMRRWNLHGYNGLCDIANPETEKVMTEWEMMEIDKALKMLLNFCG